MHQAATTGVVGQETQLLQKVLFPNKCETIMHQAATTCVFTKTTSCCKKLSFQQMRNNYAPGSHDWFVPNTLLHLNTNLFN